MADYKIPVITGTELSEGDLLRWNGSNWVNYADSTYSLSSHLHDGSTLQLDGVNSDGGAFSFNTTGAVTFNQSIGAANYSATNLLTACATNAGALDFSAASKTLTVENDAVVSQDYSSDASPIFAGLDLTGITDGNVPYMSAGGFADSTINMGTYTVSIGDDTDNANYGLNVSITNTGGIRISSGNYQLFLHDNDNDRFWAWTTTASGGLGFMEGTEVPATQYFTMTTDPRFGINESSPITSIEITDTEPYITLHNSTHENGDGGRESRLIARGEKLDETEHVLGYLEFAHDGAADDQKGLFRILLNDGNDDTSPSITPIQCYSNGTVEFTKTVYFDACQTTTGDGTTTIDWGLGNKFYFTFGSQSDTFTFTAPDGPCNLVLVLKQDGTGSREATWPESVMWPSGTAPTLTTDDSSIDIISFFYDGTNYFGNSSLNFSVPA